MKAVLIQEPKKIDVVEVEDVKLSSDNDVLVNVKAGGLCGSDIHIFHGSNPFAEYPCVPGHEFAGQVIEIGSKVKNLEIGDHVSIDPVVSCGECYACKQGRYNVCETLEVRGVHVDGGFREKISVPSDAAHKISKEIPWEHAALVEPFTIAAQSTSRGRITKDDVVFIAGAGSIGLCILITAKSLGCTVAISDLSDVKLARAKECGADYIINTKEQSLEAFVETTDGIDGFTLALDAVGHPSILESMLPVMVPTGRVVVLGFLKAPTELIQFYITKKELDILGSRLAANKFPGVIKAFEERRIDPSKIITHVKNYKDVKDAVNLLVETPDECCKVVVTF